MESAFDEVAGAVGFSVFAHEEAGGAYFQGQAGGQWDATQFQAGEAVEAGWEQGLQFIHNGTEQFGVAFDAVFIPVEVAGFSGAQGGLAGEVGGGSGFFGKLGFIHESL